MLTQAQFDLLYTLSKTSDTAPTQRQLATQTALSLGKVNQVLAELREAQLIESDYRVTEKGHQSLAPYRVTNAVIMAAGMSTRFAPLSYERPKALLTVKGERLIERQIKQLREAGVQSITIVVGYMKEKMFYLGDKFDVEIVVNEDYYRYNNTSSLMLVRERLDNTYICSSDNYFVENPFESHVYRGYYATVFESGVTNEYCVTTDRSGKITDVTIGGENAWIMLGHVYYDRSFSQRFSQLLTAEYEKPSTREGLWEDLYIQHLDQLSLTARHYSTDVIKEFDSLDELRQFDHDYLKYSNSAILQNITQVLNCQEQDIQEIKPIKNGMTNTSFRFTCLGKHYVYRHPGKGTEAFINRHSEAASMQVAQQLGLDTTFIYMDPEQGWKLSYYIENARTLDYRNSSDVQAALTKLRLLHQSAVTTDFAFDIWAQIEQFQAQLKATDKLEFDDMPQLVARIDALKPHLIANGTRCLCHNDSYDPNFLIDASGNMSLIDWEYSGMADPACDLGTFLACSPYDLVEAEAVIQAYFEQQATPEQVRHYLGYAAVLAFYWFLWALHQESVGKPVGHYLYMWYRYTKAYSDKALGLYEGRN